jgi:spore germination protein
LKRYQKILISFITFVVYSTSINITVQEAAAATELPFDDISGSYAQNQIIDLYNKKMISGTGYRSFEPNKQINRAEFVTMVDNILHLQPANNDIGAFSDVQKNEWYYGYVQAGINLNFVSGTSIESFEPEKSITRQEAATLLIRALKQNAVPSNTNDLGFQDADQIASWAIPYVNAIKQLGLMVGSDGYFRPNDAMTRQEVAAVLDKVVNKTNDASQGSTSQSKIQIGWQYNQTNQQFEQSVMNSNINTISPRWFFIEENGQVSDQADSSLVAWAASHNKKVWPMFGNHFNSELTHLTITDPSKRKAVIQQIQTFVQKYGLDGINLDFENVAAADRSAFTTFIAELASSLHDVHATLSVDVSPNQGTDWTGAFDFVEIGKYADYVVLMNYEEYWTGSPSAGSVSSLPWFQQSIQTLLADVSPSKVIVALPLYTRDWTLQSKVTSEDLSLVNQGELLRKVQNQSVWDSVLGQYVVSYDANGAQHRIWAEDSRSLTAKYVSAANLGVAGYGYWYIGAETPDIWTGLSNAERYSSFVFKP